ncbi:MAG: phosphotransferase [Bacteroidota bacterium]
MDENALKKAVLSKPAGRDRRQHQQEVQTFLQKHFASRSWEFALPSGSGKESYFAHGSESSHFVKLGVEAAIYQAVASTGLTPQVLAAGCLEDGTSIIVQPYIAGRSPSRRDYRIHLDEFAAAIRKLHHSAEARRVLQKAPSELYRSAGLEALARLRERWERYKIRVPEFSEFVDGSLDHLGQEVRDFEGAGLAASHNDICNANWLITPDSRLYLIDLESMSLDDPALDIGATLWWYYPPELRTRFLRIVGHANDQAFEKRMRVRMAMHCLSITLPRELSYDKFSPTSFAGWFTDFKAIVAGEENPEGYED